MTAAPSVDALSRHTPAEERANMLTHALGVVLSVVGVFFLLTAARRAEAPYALASCAIYGVTLVLLYTASTLYHRDPKPRLRTLDHIAIFLLIAGTYAPFELVTLRGGWGWGLFAITWGLAVFGVVLELTPLRRFRGAMIALYIAMGWVGLIALTPLVAALPGAGLWLLFGGGAMYTGGVVFYRMHRLRYHHAVWHLFVLGGSVLQYFAVLCYVLPQARV
ncbi:MAG: hemolysin III family protein [Rudaea sp.]